VLVVTTDGQRIGSMIDALQQLRAPRGAEPSLFLFATFADLGLADPLQHQWLDRSRRNVDLI
jgi:hypothetical protein